MRAMIDPITAAAIRKAQAALSLVVDVRRLAGFSLSRTISLLASDSPLDGFEREALQYAADTGGQPFDPRRPVIPWKFLANERDMTFAGANSVGFLGSGEIAGALDVLRPWSACMRAGATIVEAARNDQLVPRTTPASPISWHAAESTRPSTTLPTIGQIALKPKTATGVVNMSRPLLMQSSAERFTRRDLSRWCASTMDTALINGSGTGGQPTGLINAAGIQTQRGADLGHAEVCSMKRVVADQNASDEIIAFIGTNSVRELLETRERAGGAGFVWDNDRVASRPAYTTTVMPVSTLVCGSWPDAMVVLYGGGVEISIDADDSGIFKSGVVQVCCAVTLDIAIGHPAAFCVASSIT